VAFSLLSLPKSSIAKTRKSSDHISLNYLLKEAIAEPMFVVLFALDSKLQNLRRMSVELLFFSIQNLSFCGDSITLQIHTLNAHGYVQSKNQANYV
jgi:hypothetical protein